MSTTVNTNLKIGKGFCSYRGMELSTADGSFNTVANAINEGVPDEFITLAIENDKLNLLHYFCELSNRGLWYPNVCELIYQNINNENLEVCLRDALLFPRYFNEMFTVLINLNSKFGILLFELAKRGYSLAEIRKLEQTTTIFELQKILNEEI